MKENCPICGEIIIMTFPRKREGKKTLQLFFVLKEDKRCLYFTKCPCASSLGSKPEYGKSISGEQGNEPHIHTYICDTDHKMRAKNTAQLFKVYNFFSCLTLLLH